MSQDIVPVPALEQPGEFPTTADRNAGTYNSKAIGWAGRLAAFGGSIWAIAQSAFTNAGAAKVSAQTALQAAASANDARAAVWDAVGLQGQWLEATGAAQKGWVYKHNGRFWRLKQAVADIAAHEPQAENAFWLVLDAGARPQVTVASGTVVCVTGVTYIITGADVTLTAPATGLIQGDYFGFRLAAAVSGTQRIDFGSINVRGQSAGTRYIDKPGLGIDLEFNSTKGWV